MSKKQSYSKYYKRKEKENSKEYFSIFNSCGAEDLFVGNGEILFLKI